MTLADFAPYLLGLAAVITAIAGFGKLFVDTAKINAQFRNNGGSSLKDSLDSVAATTDRVDSRLTRMDTRLNNVDSRLTRVEECLAEDPEPVPALTPPWRRR